MYKIDIINDRFQMDVTFQNVETNPELAIVFSREKCKGCRGKFATQFALN